MSDDSETAPCDDADAMRVWRECGLPEYFLGRGGTNRKLAAFAERLRADCEDRIARALEAEAELGGCSEDSAVLREAAWLVRADFSYEEADRLQARAGAKAGR